MLSGANYIITTIKQSFQLKEHITTPLVADNKLYPIDVKKGIGTLNSLEKLSNHNKFEALIMNSSILAKNKVSRQNQSGSACLLSHTKF